MSSCSNYSFSDVGAKMTTKQALADSNRISKTVCGALHKNLESLFDQQRKTV